MRKLWFAYGDLGYDGVNGKRAKIVKENLHLILSYFNQRLGERIAENI
jgi:hypothetical protein